MSNNKKRIQVNFTEEQYNLLQQFKGELGNSDSEVVKIITLLWLSEKSLIPSTLKEKMLGDENLEI